jgi:hypothetical protein
MTHKPATPAARNDFISKELVDVRRLLDALNKIIEDYVGADLEAYEPVVGLVDALSDKIVAAIKAVEDPMQDRKG